MHRIFAPTFIIQINTCLAQCGSDTQYIDPMVYIYIHIYRSRVSTFDCQEEEGEEELPETEADAWTLRKMGCKLHGYDRVSCFRLYIYKENV